MGSVCGKETKDANSVSILEQGQSQAFEAKQASIDQNYGHARRLFQQSITNLKQALLEARHPEMVKNILAQTYIDQGDLFANMNNTSEALQSYQEAQKLGAKCQAQIDAITKHAPANTIHVSPAVAPILPSMNGAPSSNFGASQISMQPIKKVRHFTKNYPLPKPAVNGLVNGKFADTRALAQALQATDKSSDAYANYLSLALEVVNNFALLPVKRRPIIEELVALAAVEDEELWTELLEKLIGPIKSGVLLSPSLLEGLAKVIEHANPSLIDADDCVQILKVLQDRLSNIHVDGGEIKLRKLLQAMSRLLNAMVDANVKGLKRVEQFEALHDTLSGFKDSADPIISWQANFAQQALTRIPNDESKLAAFLRRGVALTKGIVALKTVLFDMDPAELLTAYEHFSVALKMKAREKSWFNELRYAELLLQSGQFVGFEEFISTPKLAKSCQSESFSWGVAHLIETLINSHTHPAVHENALDFLHHLLLSSFDENSQWSQDKKVREKITDILLNLAQHPNDNLRQLARKVIQAIKNSSIQKIASTIAKQLPNVDLLPPRVESVKTFSTKLIEVAQTKPVSGSDIQLELNKISALISEKQDKRPEESVIDKLKALRQRILEDKDIQDELALYVPMNGAYKIHDQQTFDMEKRAKEFFNDNKLKVLLLLGNAGGGKSTFNRYIERRLWETYQEGDAIPLFVALPSLPSIDKTWLVAHLTRLGFTGKEIEVLKAKYRWNFILDGYDEINKLVNFYTLSDFNTWQAKILISCRTQYLIDKPNYSQFFAPFFGEKPQLNTLLELTVVPFGKQQISHYVNKYIELNRNELKDNPAWQQDSLYLKHFQTLPGLAELVTTPFLLMITMEVLPRIIQEFEEMDIAENERTKLTQAKLYDKFVQKWFEREENKLIAKGQLPDDGRDVKEDFWEFGKNLAVEMVKADTLQVSYAPRSTLFGNKALADNQWEQFFTQKNPDMLRARRACPLRKVGPNRYAFIHASLLEYFYTKAILDQELGAAAEDNLTAGLGSTASIQSAAASSIQAQIGFFAKKPQPASAAASQAPQHRFVNVGP